MDIVTLAASRKYTDKKIAESASVGIKYKIVDSLPSSGEAQTIYFVKNDSSWINNYYDEYVWISSSGSFEKIGSTQLDDFIQNPSAAEVGQTIVVKEVNEEGKPIAWEMADLPEQAQADWNQNDSAAADYVKNRTHWVETKQKTDVRSFEPTSSDGYSFTDLEYANLLFNNRDSVSSVWLLSGNFEMAECGWDDNEKYFKFAYSVMPFVDKRIVYMRLQFDSNEMPTGDITITDKLSQTWKISITVNYEETEVHKLDSKFIPKQIQSDWNQNDETAVDYVKNRPFYSTFELVATASHHSGTNVSSFMNISWPEIACVEINGIQFQSLNSYRGDGDSSLWANGGGMGFYIERIATTYDIYIDENRFGPTNDAVIKLYKQTIIKKLSSEYIPLATRNQPGVVKAIPLDSNDEYDEYESCAVNEFGHIYAKKYAPAKVYYELSVSNLNLLTNLNGDHGLFIGSMSDEFSGSGLVFPVHAWYSGVDYSSSPYKKIFVMESADGMTYLVKIANDAIYSAEQIAQVPLNMYINVTQNEDGSFSADKTFAEIQEHINNGGTASAIFNQINMALILVVPELFRFHVFLEGSHGFLDIDEDDSVHFNEFILYNEFVSLHQETTDSGKILMVGDDGVVAPSDLILPSSTTGSTKKFKITVDDSGIISATEVTA